VARAGRRLLARARAARTFRGGVPRRGPGRFIEIERFHRTSLGQVGGGLAMGLHVSGPLGRFLTLDASSAYSMRPRLRACQLQFLPSLR
jgi:hypothetical protein